MESNLRFEGYWLCADVETALFSYASQQMEVRRSTDASRCAPEQDLEEGTMQQVKTWAEKSEFRYEGSVKEGVVIHYGNDFAYTAKVSAEQFQRLLTHFRGRTVPLGTSRTNPPEDSVGAWLKENVTKTAIASYVGPILIKEGYAEKIGSDIQFR